MANCPYDKVSLFGNLSQGKLFHGKLSRGKKSSGEKSQSCRPIGYRNFPITFLSCALKRNKIEETNSRQFFFCERGGTQNYRARIFRRRTVRRKKKCQFRLGQIKLDQVNQVRLVRLAFFTANCLTAKNYRAQNTDCLQKSSSKSYKISKKNKLKLYKHTSFSDECSRLQFFPVNSSVFPICFELLHRKCMIIIYL